MKLQLFSTLTFIAASFAAPIADIEESGLAPPSASIDGLSYGGTGCPQGSLKYVLSSDLKTITLLYPNDYTAEVGPHTPITEARKNCQIALSIKYPAGYSFAVTTSNYIGYIQIDKGVTAEQKTLYYFAGETSQAQDGTTWNGPANQVYQIENKVPASVWSSCDGSSTLNVNSQARLDAATHNLKGKLTTDLGRLSLGVGLVWKKC